LEHPHRSALENHVHRTPRLGNHGLLNVRIGITRICLVEMKRSSESISTSLFLTKTNPPVASSAVPSFAFDGKVEIAQRKLANKKLRINDRCLESFPMMLAPDTTEQRWQSSSKSS
jgi:hypothetical protein